MVKHQNNQRMLDGKLKSGRPCRSIARDICFSVVCAIWLLVSTSSAATYTFICAGVDDALHVSVNGQMVYSDPPGQTAHTLPPISFSANSGDTLRFWAINYYIDNSCGLNPVSLTFPDGTSLQIFDGVSGVGAVGATFVDVTYIIPSIPFTSIKNTPDGGNSGSEAEPVNTASGAYYMDKQLLRHHGARDLSLELRYNSRLLDEGPLGRGWSHGFESEVEDLGPDQIKVHTDRKRYNTFGTGGTIAQVFGGNERFVSYDTTTRNPDGTTTLRRRDGSGMEFDTAGRLSRVKDRNGRGLQVTRDASNRIQTVTEPASGKSLTFSYNAGAKLERVTASDGRKAIFGYDGSNCMTSLRLESADGTHVETTTYEYDANHRLVAATTPDGNQILRNSYDDAGRVIEQQDGTSPEITVGGVTIPAKAANVTGFAYDTSAPGFFITTITDRLGNTKTHKHDEHLQLVEETDELGHKTTHTYDDRGNRVSTTDPRGNTTTLTYDDNGHITRIDHPGGAFETFVRDAAGNALSHTDEAGHTTTATFDGNITASRKSSPEPVHQPTPGNTTPILNRPPAPDPGVGSRPSPTRPAGPPKPSAQTRRPSPRPTIRLAGCSPSPTVRTARRRSPTTSRADLPAW